MSIGDWLGFEAEANGWSVRGSARTRRSTVSAGDLYLMTFLSHIQARGRVSQNVVGSLSSPISPP
jgi:hypothetical protein